MARRTKTTNAKPSKLKAFLESGKNISGLVGFVPMTDDEDGIADVFVKVKCMGLSTKSGCSVSVLVKPFAGTGQFTISPCKWFDTPADVTAARELRAKQDAATEDYSNIMRHSLHSSRRLALAELIDALPKVSRSRVMADIEDRKLTTRTLDTNNVRQYARAACLEKHGLDEKTKPSNYEFGRD
jgi:hypothetical protein